MIHVTENTGGQRTSKAEKSTPKPVNAVVLCLSLNLRRHRNFALVPAICRVEKRSIEAVDETYMNRVFHYTNIMAQAKRLLGLGIITSEEYADIDTIMTKQYDLSLDSIFHFSA